MTLEDIANLPAPKMQTIHMRNVSLSFARMLIDGENKLPTFECEDLKLWHLSAAVGENRFIITVVISSAGSTMSVPLLKAPYLDFIIRTINAHIKH